MVSIADRPAPGRCSARGAWRRALRLWLAAAVLGLAILPCGTREAAALSVGTTESALLLWIAEERGYFDNQGLDVHIRLFQSGLSAVNALAAGEVDLSTASETALVSKSFTHPDLRILAVISTSDTARLIGRRDRGIETAADLAGKRIGVTAGTIGEYFLARYLTLQSVPVGAPTLVNLEPAQITQGLVTGNIDAGLTWEPFVRTAELALKDNLRLLPDQNDQLFYFLLLVKQSWADENGEQVGKFLRALIEAEKYASENPAKAKELVRRRFNYAQDYIDHLWPLHNLHVSLPQGLMLVLERQAEWQIRRGLTGAKTVPVFLDFIATAPLAALSPVSVSIDK